ncbi:MAG: radical SAM protein [Candidatus Margulisiibacteriota bacterium]
MICHYYLTYDCNCRCDYCHIWQDSGLNRLVVPSIATLKQNLNTLKKLGCKEILFTGGEPLLYDDLPEALKFAKNQGFLVYLCTNGLLSSKMLSSAAGLLDKLYISLDYPLETEHNAVKAQECFLEAMDTISLALHLGVEPVINYTLSRDSIRYLPELIELAQEKKVKVRLVPVHHCPALEGFEKISFDYIRRYAASAQVIFDKQLFELLTKGGNNTGRTSCSVMDNVISISPDDNLILPCIWAGQATIPINGDLERTMSSDIVKGYRRLQGTFEACRGCVAEESINRSFFGKVKSADILGKIIRPIGSFLRGR